VVSRRIGGRVLIEGSVRSAVVDVDVDHGTVLR
jgi:hypothetical protein